MNSPVIIAEVAMDLCNEGIQLLDGNGTDFEHEICGDTHTTISSMYQKNCTMEFGQYDARSLK